AAAYDHWVAFGLLTAIGGKMLWEARSEEYFQSGTDPTRGLMLVGLSVATSIDALAVGLSIAMLSDSIWTAAVVIGLVAATLSTVGVLFGNRLGTRCGRWAAAVGGCVLVGIGVRILVSHLAV
ncbi:MAG TPA: manganese efflux pump MntP family protein, partial [Thermoguttaceae bacterium]|nr:manganese efflux pump MntP family protein [Thermoguttaceae bacterium]